MVKDVTPCLSVGHIPRRKVESSVAIHYFILSEKVRQVRIRIHNNRCGKVAVHTERSGNPLWSSKVVPVLLLYRSMKGVLGERPVNEL